MTESSEGQLRFQPGEQVRSKSDAGRIGTVQGPAQLHGGVQYYRVFWGGISSARNVSELDLERSDTTGRPHEDLAGSGFAGHAEFQRLMTYHRLARDTPLRNNIYAFNASRTRFYPYQFKPVIKLLDSPDQRIMVCDEVGLGKTIEAGLILSELRARGTMDRVLVVCPSSLCSKWRLELKQRFGEDFTILDSKRFKEFLGEYAEDRAGSRLNGILSLQSARTQGVIEALEAVQPGFDLVIVDEAHHLRNTGTRQRKALAVGRGVRDGLLSLQPSLTWAV